MIERTPSFEKPGDFKKGDKVMLNEKTFEKQRLAGITIAKHFKMGVEYVVFYAEVDDIFIGPADTPQEDIDVFSIKEYLRPNGGRYPKVGEFKAHELRKVIEE